MTTATMDDWDHSQDISDNLTRLGLREEPMATVVMNKPIVIPYNKEHTIFIRQVGDRYNYSLMGISKDRGYITSPMGTFSSSYEAFQAAREAIDGPDD